MRRAPGMVLVMSASDVRDEALRMLVGRALPEDERRALRAAIRRLRKAEEDALWALEAGRPDVAELAVSVHASVLADVRRLVASARPAAA